MILNDTEIKYSQTHGKSHHALNINTKVYFVHEHNISSTSKTTLTLRERQFAGFWYKNVRFKLRWIVNIANDLHSQRDHAYLNGGSSLVRMDLSTFTTFGLLPKLKNSALGVKSTHSVILTSQAKRLGSCFNINVFQACGFHYKNKTVVRAAYLLIWLEFHYWWDDVFILKRPLVVFLLKSFNLLHK